MNPLQGSGVSERSRCVPCPSCRGPMNPLQGSGVCESAPTRPIPVEGSSARQGWARHHSESAPTRPIPVEGFELAMNPLQDRACRSALAVVPCPSCRGPDEPSTGIGRGLARSRCGAVRILELADEPSTGIGRVGALSLWCRAHPCRADEPSTGIGRVGALSLWLPCPSLPWPMNPLQGSGVSARSRCGAVPILAVADEPSTGIGRVGALSL